MKGSPMLRNFSIGASPAKQQSTRKYAPPSEDGVPASLSEIEAKSKAKLESSHGRVTAKRGKSKVDYMQHVTGVNKNTTGKKIEKGRTDYLKSLDNK